MNATRQAAAREKICRCPISLLNRNNDGSRHRKISLTSLLEKHLASQANISNWLKAWMPTRREIMQIGKIAARVDSQCRLILLAKPKLSKNASATRAQKMLQLVKSANNLTAACAADSHRCNVA
jgi:hypothetical protein